MMEKIGFTGDCEIMLIWDALTLSHTTEVTNTTVEIFSRTQPLLDFMWHYSLYVLSDSGTPCQAAGGY